MGRQKKNIPASIEEIKDAVAKNKSIAGALKTLGLVPFGGNYIRIKRIIQEHQIDTSHFTGQGWNTGDRYTPIPHKTYTDDEIFTTNSKYLGSTSNIKSRLIRIRQTKCCECCGLSEWMGDKIPLELHHINGDRTDNRVENLQILCPNCHAKTDNWRRRKTK